MNMNNIKEQDQKYVANTYARFPLALVRGEGSLVYDDEGKEYIDLGTGIAVNTFGFSDKEWIAAVTEQLSKLQHTSNLYYSELRSPGRDPLRENGYEKSVFLKFGS